MKDRTQKVGYIPTTDDANRLRALADWFDTYDAKNGNEGMNEVQTSLRGIADRIDFASTELVEQQYCKCFGTIMVMRDEEDNPRCHKCGNIIKEEYSPELVQDRTAEEILRTVDELNYSIVDTANGKILHMMFSNVLECMHILASSEVARITAIKDEDMGKMGQIVE